MATTNFRYELGRGVASASAGFGRGAAPEPIQSVDVLVGEADVAPADDRDFVAHDSAAMYRVAAAVLTVLWCIAQDEGLLAAERALGPGIERSPDAWTRERSALDGAPARRRPDSGMDLRGLERRRRVRREGVPDLPRGRAGAPGPLPCGGASVAQDGSGRGRFARGSLVRGRCGVPAPASRRTGVARRLGGIAGVLCDAGRHRDAMQPARAAVAAGYDEPGASARLVRILRGLGSEGREERPRFAVAVAVGCTSFVLPCIEGTGQTAVVVRKGLRNGHAVARDPGDIVRLFVVRGERGRADS